MKATAAEIGAAGGGDPQGRIAAGGDPRTVYAYTIRRGPGRDPEHYTQRGGGTRRTLHTTRDGRDGADDAARQYAARLGGPAVSLPGVFVRGRG